MLIARHISHDSNSIFNCSIKNIFIRALTAVFVLLFLKPSTGHCELRSMSASEMKASTGQAGFTQVTMNNNTARLFLDIHIETFATMDTLSIGGYEKNNNPGWDLQWNDVTIGNTVDKPLEVDGLVFIADFDEVTNKLERVVVGSNRLQGDVAATMSSFSGAYNDALTGGNGSMITTSDRYNLGQQTFNFDSDARSDSDMGLFFVLNTDPANPGIQVVAGYDEKTITTLSPGVWWDSP